VVVFGRFWAFLGLKVLKSAVYGRFWSVLVVLGRFQPKELLQKVDEKCQKVSKKGVSDGKNGRF
jgi:hypothetical protein